LDLLRDIFRPQVRGLWLWLRLGLVLVLNVNILSARTGPYDHLSPLFVRVSKYSSNFVAGVMTWPEVVYRRN